MKGNWLLSNLKGNIYKGKEKYTMEKKKRNIFLFIFIAEPNKETWKKFFRNCFSFNQTPFIETYMNRYLY